MLAGENLLGHTVVPDAMMCSSVFSVLSLSMYFTFFCQFEYDKEPEVNVTFYIKDKVTDRKIDSTLRGTFQ